MSDSVRATCRVVRPGHTAYDGKQRLSYFDGIANRQSTGAATGNTKCRSF
jgi:uncharacterized RmlC-like cupin family protein